MSEQLNNLKQLRNLPIFRRLDIEVLRATAPFWRFHQLEKGEILWMEGDTEGSMGVVVAGVLGVVLEGKTVATVGPGELVGEGTAFAPDAPRIATVKAAATTLVAVLKRKALLNLRAEHGIVYDELLMDAVRTAARRVREMDRKVARYSEGDDAVPDKGPSVVGRLWQKLTGQAGESKPPELKPLLARMMIWPLRNPAVLERLASKFEAEKLVKGQALFLEGENADKAFIVVSGAVDVYRYTGAQKARKLATVQRGALLGFGALLVARTRSASCVASESGWAFSIDRATFTALSDHPGRFFREMLLQSLYRQVNIANTHLAELEVPDDGTPDGQRRRRDTLDRALSAMMGAGGDS